MNLISDLKTAAPALLKPPLVISQQDYEQLLAFANAALRRNPDDAEELIQEVERALVVSAPEMLQSVVGMNSDVEFRDELTGKVQRVKLVYPGEADISTGKISVLTPIGTALIGLSAGQSISWRTRSGEPRSLTVVSVG